MMLQKRPSDIIHPADPDNTWQQTTMKSQKQETDFTAIVLPNKHISDEQAHIRKSDAI
jgi:hypothetical protein